MAGVDCRAGPLCVSTFRGAFGDLCRLCTPRLGPRAPAACGGAGFHAILQPGVPPGSAEAVSHPSPKNCRVRRCLTSLSAPAIARPCWPAPATPVQVPEMVGCCSSVVERILGKAEVESSILSSSTISVLDIWVAPESSELASSSSVISGACVLPISRVTNRDDSNARRGHDSGRYLQRAKTLAPVADGDVGVERRVTQANPRNSRCSDQSSGTSPQRKR